MTQRTSFRRLPHVIALVAAGGLLTACGTLTDEPGQSGGNTDVGLPADESGGEYTGPETHELDMEIRVVNLYIPDGETEGQEIEVWFGSPEYYGEKLATIGYGEVSEFFAPLSSEPETGDDEPGTVDWTIGYYPAGATTDDQRLMDSAGSLSPGQKTTTVVMPAEPGGVGASVQGFPDSPGEEPDAMAEEFFYDVPEGQGMFLLSAAPIQHLRDDQSDSSPSYIASDGAGSCLPSYDTTTGELTDYSDGITPLIGGTQILSYVFDQGGQVAVHRVIDNQFPGDACAGETVLDAVSPELGEGDRAYGLIYGSSLDQLELLVIPVG